MTKKEIGVRALRDDLPTVLEQVQNSGESVKVMRHKEVVAELVPVAATSPLPRIIALASLKGGVGKTTLTMHLAAVLSAQGESVVVLDADDEHSAYHWAQVALAQGPLNFEVLQANRDSLMRQASELKKAGKMVILDTPPNNREILNRAAMVADLVLVPLLPAGMDLDRSASTLVLLADIEAVRPNFNYAFVLNRFDERLRISKAVKKEVEQAGVPALQTFIPASTVYVEAFGKQPTHLSGVEALWQEVKTVFGDEA